MDEFEIDKYELDEEGEYDDFSIEVEHIYNVILLKLTDDLGVESVKLIELLRENQPKQEFTLTEISMQHFKEKELSGYDCAEIMFLLQAYCELFVNASIYIFGDLIHEDDLIKSFESNPNRFKDGMEIKLVIENSPPILLNEE